MSNEKQQENLTLKSGGSRTKKFMHNSISTAVYQVILMISGFITPKIMLDCYGSEVNGLVSSIQQFMTHFQIVEAGISGAAIFALYLPLAQQDHKRINAIVSASRKFYFQSGYIFVGLVVALSIGYMFLVPTPELAPWLVALLVLSLGGKGFMDFFTLAKYRVLLSADQRTYMISIASSVYIILNTLFIVIFSYMKMNVVLVYALSIVSMYVRSLILKIYVKRHYKYINYHETPDSTALNKRWDVLYQQILATVQKSAPTILATMLTPLKQVSVYAIYNMVLVGINDVLGIFTTGLVSSFGDVIARGQIKTLQKSYSEFSLVYYSLITIAYPVTAVMIVPFVIVYTKGVHDVNYNVPIIGFLFALNGLLYNMKTPQAMLTFSAGLYKETRVQASIQGLIIIIGGLIFGYFWGLIGILIASCLSNLYRVIDLMIFVPKHVTKMPIRITVFSYTRMIINCMIIMLPFTLFIDLEKLTPNFFMWAVWALIVTVYAAVIVLASDFLFEREVFWDVMKRVKKMIPGKKHA